MFGTWLNLCKKTWKNLSTSGSSCTRAERWRRRHIKAALWTLCGDDSLHGDAPLAKPPAFEGENRQMSCNQAAGENTFTPRVEQSETSSAREHLNGYNGLVSGYCAIIECRQTDRIQDAASRVQSLAVTTT